MNIKMFFSAVSLGCFVALTGCSSLPRNTSGNLYTFPKGSYDEPRRFEHSDESVDENDLAEAVKEFPIEEISLPDGSTVSKYSAVSGNENSLCFDFGFYKIAAPVFGTSFDNSDIIKYDADGKPRSTLDFSELSKEFKTDCRKVVKGDVPENGLVVDHACCWISASGELVGNNVFFKGQITLSGYLTYEYHPSHANDPSNGTLWFIPDTTRNSVPTYYGNEKAVYHFWGDYESNKPFLLYSDSCPWELGNTKSEKYSEFNLENIFSGKSYAAVSVTVKDPIFGWQGNGFVLDNEFFGERFLFGKCASGTIVDIYCIE